MQEQEFPVSQNNNLVDKVEKEKEIIALINSKGTFTSQITSENKNLLVANAELIAYIDCDTNELHKSQAKIEWLVTVEDSKKNFIYNIEKYHIYHLKVKEADTDNFLLIDVLERDIDNELLKKTLKECEQKAAIVIEEPDLGKFILDKGLKAFLSKIEWLDSKKLKIYAAENLVDLANELRKNLKGMFKFIKIWKWRFIQRIKLIRLEINSNGEFVATFDDGKLFVGHKIAVNGNVNGELINSAIVENFNIEDYKKVELALSVNDEKNEDVSNEAPTIDSDINDKDNTEK